MCSMQQPGQDLLQYFLKTPIEISLNLKFSSVQTSSKVEVFFILPLECKIISSETNMHCLILGYKM